ncbi:MAG: CusA/CzcA family heavy metal efflux RND transporter [Planctomycetes bacterium]|nr:CusA/CzcA family heavy metal efflux RND transporter [Planctomycetota bacterium]
MINSIISWSVDRRYVVLMLLAGLIALGAFSYSRLPVDAFPDTTPVQVQINTVVPALSPIEVEQQLTFPVEQAISGIPGLSEVRSISKYGLSQVTAIFGDDVDLYFARQLILERMQMIELPDGAPQPEIGPAATGLGEVFHYLVRGDGRSLEELTTIQNWVIRPRLRSVPGVAEVNTWGGETKQYHVLVDLDSLMGYELTLGDVHERLRENNVATGGGNIVQAGELEIVSGQGLMKNVPDIESTFLRTYEGVSVNVRDVADVTVGHEIRRGAATANGAGEAVLGLGFMLKGENSAEVTTRLKDKVAEIQSTLPEGVEIVPVYDRTELVDQVIATVKTNLIEGALLVIAVLFLFLGNLRAGLIVAAAIPLSLCFAFTGMWQYGIVGSLMSLGAIDFGFIVDSTLVMIENNVRRIEEGAPSLSRLELVKRASIQVARPTIFAQTINMIVYLPLLALEGIEGKLFAPMSITILFALSGSVILICTAMPALAALFLKTPKKAHRDRIVNFLKRLYKPAISLTLRKPALFCALPVLVFAGIFALASNTGAEFIPRLSETGIVINTVRLSGASIEEGIRYGTQIEMTLLEEFPAEIENVWTRTGTAEVATDPMGIELSDVFITLTDRTEWTRAKTQDELTSQMREELSGMPGMRMIFTQPIEMRVNEMIAGIRSDLGIKIFGDDLDTLREKAAEVQTILQSIDGASDVFAEQITGQPVLEISLDRDALSRRGVTVREAMDVVSSIGTWKAGEIREDQRRFDLCVRLAPKHRTTASDVANIPVQAVSGERLRLADLATIREVEGPSTITREWQKRRIVVQCNVTGRDIGGFVREVRERIQDELELPAEGGYHVEYGGQFEHLERASLRLMIVVPLALALIFILLRISTGSLVASLIIFLGPAFATLGGLAALFVRGLDFTIAAGVGFVIVSGVSVLNGLVMLATIREIEESGTTGNAAIIEGALSRLRPIVMAALVSILGFLPMALSEGVGAEVQRPLASVVIGGIIFDNFLTLLLLPPMYKKFVVCP